MGKISDAEFTEIMSAAETEAAEEPAAPEPKAKSAEATEEEPAAPAPEADAAPAEPAAPVEEPKEVVPPKVLAQLLRRESQARQVQLQAREALKQVEALRAELTQAKSAREQLQRMAQEDPIRFLEETRVNFDDLVKGINSGRAPKPPDPTSDAIAELRRELAEMRQDREARVQAEQRREQQARQQEAARWFVSQVSAAPDKYPHAAMLDPDEVIERISNLARRQAERGFSLDDNELLSTMESGLAQFAKKLSSREIKAKASVSAATGRRDAESPVALTSQDTDQAGKSRKKTREERREEVKRLID